MIRLAISLAAIALVIVAVGAVTIPWHLTVAASGTLEPDYVWSVRSTASGIVSKLSVATGDTVRPGQVLAMLDTTQVAADLRRFRVELDYMRNQLSRTASLVAIEQVNAESYVARAEANLMRSRANLREELANRGITAELDAIRVPIRPGTNVAVDRAYADVLTAEADLRSARAQGVQANAEARMDEVNFRVAQLQAQLALTREQLSRMRLMSAEAGTVITDGIERLVGASTQAGETLFEIASLSGWIAKLVVGEGDAHRIRMGDSVSLEIPSLAEVSPGRTWGTIQHFGREPIASSAVRAGYLIKVRLESPVPDELRRAMRRGLSVRARVVIGRSTIANWLLERFRR